jgi:hypothetical protein
MLRRNISSRTCELQAPPPGASPVAAQHTAVLSLAPTIEPDRALRLGASAAAAPLWGAYMAAAGAGVAFWWMTAWTRQTNFAFEAKAFMPALKAPVAKTVKAVEAVVEAAAPVVEDAPVEFQAIDDAAVEVAQSVAAPSVATKIEAVTPAPVKVEPVKVEAVPTKAEVAKPAPLKAAPAPASAAPTVAKAAPATAPAKTIPAKVAAAPKASVAKAKPRKS